MVEDRVVEQLQFLLEQELLLLEVAALQRGLSLETVKLDSFVQSKAFLNPPSILRRSARPLRLSFASCLDLSRSSRNSFSL